MLFRRLMLCALAGLLLAGCTTVETRATGRTKPIQMEPDAVFDLAVQSAVNAGMTVRSVEKSSSNITAVRGGNKLLTWNDPEINILVSESTGGTLVVINSAVGGQVIDYGTTAATVTDFCAAFNALVPDADCTVL